MPLPSRVDPFGQLFADASRGLLMGNRGGRFHRDDRSLGKRRFASRQWICCQLAFKERHRDVWGEGYTELFFLDEPTAFSAGHRPCFECRRREAEAFAMGFVGGRPPRATAEAMDAALHAERLVGPAKRRHRRPIDTLPDAAFVTLPDADEAGAWALRGDRLLAWTSSGYERPRSRPRGIEVDVLTPPSILTVLTIGYRPLWHPSAEA